MLDNSVRINCIKGTTTIDGYPRKMLRMFVSIQDLQSFFTLFFAENSHSTVTPASGRISIISMSIKM